MAKNPEDYVPLIQYLRPDGRTRKTYAPVGAAYAEMARGMALSVEVIAGDAVIIYSRFKDEPEESEIITVSNNGTATAALQEIIVTTFERRRKATKKKTAKAKVEAEAKGSDVKFIWCFLKDGFRHPFVCDVVCPDNKCNNFFKQKEESQSGKK